MKFEKLLRDLSLRTIAFFVILIALWAIVLLVGVSFNWSFLTGKVEQAFYLGGFLAGLLIFALAVLNVTACLSMIAKAQMREESSAPHILRQLVTMTGVAVTIAVLVLGGLWYAEWRVYQRVVDEARVTVQTLADKEQFAELMTAIAGDAPTDAVLKIRDALNAEVDGSSRVSLLISRERAGLPVYYEVTDWRVGKDDKKPFSELDLNRFVARKREKKEFDQLVAGEIDAFQVPSGNSDLRYFAAHDVNGQRVILVLDTSRKLDYYRGSLK